jgi:hypothetical protein
MVELDLSKLKKGDVITLPQLEMLVGLPAKHGTFKLQVLKLKEDISRRFRENHQQVITIAEVRGALHILTDELAAAYNARTFSHGRRKMRRSFYRNMGVDVRKLAAPDIIEHEKHLLHEGWVLQAMAGANKQRPTLAAVPSPMN